MGENSRSDLRLDKFRTLSKSIRTRMIFPGSGKTVDSLLVRDHSRLDLIRITDHFNNIFLLEVIDPAKREIYLLQFPPVLSSKVWRAEIIRRAQCIWGISVFSNYIARGDNCFFFNQGNLSRIFGVNSINILEERGRKVMGFSD